MLPLLQCMKVKSESKDAQSSPTLSDRMDRSLPGSSIHGIVQARVLAAAAAKSLQSCPTLCDPRDSSPPGSPVLGILQARTLEWVAIAFSLVAESYLTLLRPNRLYVVSQSPLSMEFPRQEY